MFTVQRVQRVTCLKYFTDAFERVLQLSGCQPDVMGEMVTVIQDRPGEAIGPNSARTPYTVKEGHKCIHLSWGSIVQIKKKKCQ